MAERLCVALSLIQRKLIAIYYIISSTPGLFNPAVSCFPWPLVWVPAESITLSICSEWLPRLKVTFCPVVADLHLLPRPSKHLQSGTVVKNMYKQRIRLCKDVEMSEAFMSKCRREGAPISQVISKLPRSHLIQVVKKDSRDFIVMTHATKSKSFQNVGEKDGQTITRWSDPTHPHIKTAQKKLENEWLSNTTTIRTYKPEACKIQTRG